MFSTLRPLDKNVREEWVSIRSLEDYRRALVEFVNLLPGQMGQDERPLRIA